jgi:hypothetical protein
MEINITRFFNDADAYEFSASRSERGDNAGQETWRNSLKQAEETPLLSTSEQLQEMRDYARETGAWTDDEIAEWSDSELNALFIQVVSGDMREIESLCTTDDGETDWEEYERLANAGTISGSIFRADDGDVFYYLGS